MKPFGNSGWSALEPEEARQLLPQALDKLNTEPDNIEALSYAGHCYNVLEQDDKALEYLEKAAASNNPYKWGNYGSILRQHGRNEEAFQMFERAHKELPDDRYVGHAYAEELIRKGRWLEAWPLCAKYRMSRDKVMAIGLPEWQGEDLNGKRIAVLTEGGHGDVIWLMRFLPKLKELGAIFTFLVGEDSADIVLGHPYLDYSEGTVFYSPEHPFDYWVSIFELLRWLKVSEPYWPGVYIQADPELSGYYYQSMPHAGKKKVGLVWQAGEAFDVRKYRSLNDQQARILLDEDYVCWVNLQKDGFIDDCIGCMNPVIENWKDTAALISLLDLVITVDTSVLHLAGAMGKPCWLILGGYQDCKWMTGDTTGWYPSVRIFRNDTVGFNNIIPVVRKALQEWAK